MRKYLLPLYFLTQFLETPSAFNNHTELDRPSVSCTLHAFYTLSFYSLEPDDLYLRKTFLVEGRPPCQEEDWSVCRHKGPEPDDLTCKTKLTRSTKDWMTPRTGRSEWW